MGVDKLTYKMYYKTKYTLVHPMSSLLSIRINDILLKALKANARLLQISQTEYIRQSIELMNQEIKRQERDEQLKQASLLVREESMKINAEFSEIEHDPSA